MNRQRFAGNSASEELRECGALPADGTAPASASPAGGSAPVSASLADGSAPASALPADGTAPASASPSAKAADSKGPEPWWLRECCDDKAKARDCESADEAGCAAHGCGLADNSGFVAHGRRSTDRVGCTACDRESADEAGYVACDEGPGRELDLLRSVGLVLALLCVILAVVLVLPPSFESMTDGASARVCADQQQALSEYEHLTYQGRALSWLTLTLDGAGKPYGSDEFGMAQSATTRFRAEDGSTLFYVTTSDDWGGLVGITDADGARTYVYRLR